MKMKMNFLLLKIMLMKIFQVKKQVDEIDMSVGVNEANNVTPLAVEKRKSGQPSSAKKNKK